MIAAIALGGAIGAVARWAITAGVTRATGATMFPLGTLVVNLLGCIAIGFCFIYFRQRGTPPVNQGFISVGIIGALTTFSTYTIESLDLVEKGLYSYAAFNVVGSVVLGIAAATIGIMLGKLVSGA